MSRGFGGKDPFDDPFFTRPMGSFFGTGIDNFDKLKRPVIEEVGSDDDEFMHGEDGKVGDGDQNPVVEHPDDDRVNDKDKIQSRSTNKELMNVSDSAARDSKSEGRVTRKEGVSFQRVTYGGIGGTYYTASTTRKTGKDGVSLEETREADTTTGQATHRISKGIHDKGHSLVRKLNADGKVDTVQTLHNLEEDELAGFEQSWKGNADTHIPGWDNFGPGFSSFTSVGGSRSGWEEPFQNRIGRGPGSRHGEVRAQSNGGGQAKKVVRIPIE